MEINTNELNEKVIGEQGMLYYLVECTDFLCDLPEWMHPHIDAELADKKSMHQYYEEAKGNRPPTDSEGNEVFEIAEIGKDLFLCFNANDGHENGHGDCINLVEVEGAICSDACCQKGVEKILNEDAPKSRTWPDDMEDPLLTIIIHEFEGIPEIAFAGSDKLAEKVWNRMMMNIDEMEGFIVGCDHNEEITTSNSWDEGFFGYGDDIYRKEYKTLNTYDYAGKGVEVADGDKIRAFRPGTKMPVTILTSIHSGIPETWFVGSEEEAKKEWDEAMAYIEEARNMRAKRDGEEPDYSCDYSDDGERTTKNSWEAGYFCDHKDEFRVDAYNVEVA